MTRRGTAKRFLLYGRIVDGHLLVTFLSNHSYFVVFLIKGWVTKGDLLENCIVVWEGKRTTTTIWRATCRTPCRRVVVEKHEGPSYQLGVGPFSLFLFNDKIRSSLRKVHSTLLSFLPLRSVVISRGKAQPKLP